MDDPRPVALASGVILSVWEEGPASAPALLFLHGFPENQRAWRHQVAHLAGRFRCVAPDLRGYGGSSRPEAVAAYAPEALVADVFALADALGIGRFTLIGHDWGGVLAWLAASHGGERIARLVVANAPHPALFQRHLLLDAGQRRASQYISAFRDPGLDAAVRRHGLLAALVRGFAGRDLDAMPEAGREHLLAMMTAPDERATLLAQWAEPERALAMLNWYRASPLVVPPMDAPFALPEGWREPALPRLAMPVLVLWGMEDNALLPGNLEGLGEFVADLAVRRLPGCAHFSPWQAAAAVNAALDEFLGD